MKDLSFLVTGSWFVLAEYFFKLFPDANEGLLNGYLQKYANQEYVS